MYELVLLEDFLKRPHQEVRELAGQVGKETVTIADFTHLPTHCKSLAFMPQWDFPSFLVEHGKRYPGFHVRMQADATHLIEENGPPVGVNAKTPGSMIPMRSVLTVGADGRHSVVRERAGLQVSRTWALPWMSCG